VNGRSVATIAIVDEKTRRFTIPTARLDDLPPRPFVGRMPGRPNMNNLAAGMVNDEKDVNRPEQDRLRRHVDKRYAPARQPKGIQDPEPAVTVPQSRQRVLPLQNQKLLTKTEIFRDQ
jgi:hypothetical protein